MIESSELTTNIATTLKESARSAKRKRNIRNKQA